MRLPRLTSSPAKSPGISRMFQISRIHFPGRNIQEALNSKRQSIKLQFPQDREDTHLPWIYNEERLPLSVSKPHVVPIHQMMDVVLPRMPSSQLDELCAKLQHSVTIPESYYDCWFEPLRKPANSRYTWKESALSFLQGLYGQVMDQISCVGTTDFNTFVVKSRGRRHRRPILHSPDGGLVLSHKHRKPSEQPLAERSQLLMYLSIAFDSWPRLASQHPDFNSSRILRTMQRIMDSDPRRRFVFGLEFEDDNIRLWFLSRTTTLVSTPFDIYTDWPILVRIFARLGTADRATLGYNDTVSLVKDEGGGYLYDISVNNTTFRTTKRLSDTYSDSTRVWTAREVRDDEANDKHFRLKDHWPLPSNRPEHEKLQSLKTLLQGDARSVHFPMVHAAGFVAQPKSGPQSQNEDPPRQSGVEQQMCDAESLGHGQVEGTTEAIATADHQSVDSGSKKHYRIVYEETGISIAEAETLDAALFGLQGALHGISALHDVGWLHRHITPHSILLVPRKHQRLSECLVPVLVDFEYAIEDNDEIVQGARTGSWYFMASEVMADHWTLPFCIDISDDLFTVVECMEAT